MQNLTITISPDRAEFIKLRAAELGLGSPDEFMCRLLDAEVRRCDKRQDSGVHEGTEPRGFGTLIGLAAAYDYRRPA